METYLRCAWEGISRVWFPLSSYVRRNRRVTDTGVKFDWGLTYHENT